MNILGENGGKSSFGGGFSKGFGGSRELSCPSKAAGGGFDLGGLPFGVAHGRSTGQAAQVLDPRPEFGP